MNYLWNVLLNAKNQGIDEHSLRFAMAKNFSAYLEISNSFLNQERLKAGQIIEVNPYYRFYDIFKEMYEPEMQEFPNLRQSLTNLFFHELAKNDSLSGMTKEEYYKKLLYQDLENSAYGESAKEAIGLFEREEREVILSGLLRQYRTGSSLDIFKDMIEELIPNSIVYHSNENFYEILIYVGMKKEKIITAKIDFLVQMFIDLPYHVDIYYEYHFGIIDIEETMIIGELMMC